MPGRLIHHGCCQASDNAAVYGVVAGNRRKSLIHRSMTRRAQASLMSSISPEKSRPRPPTKRKQGGLLCCCKFQLPTLCHTLGSFDFPVSLPRYIAVVAEESRTTMPIASFDSYRALSTGKASWLTCWSMLPADEPNVQGLLVCPSPEPRVRLLKISPIASSVDPGRVDRRDQWQQPIQEKYAEYCSTDRKPSEYPQ